MARSSSGYTATIAMNVPPDPKKPYLRLPFPVFPSLQKRGTVSALLAVFSVDHAQMECREVDQVFN